MKTALDTAGERESMIREARFIGFGMDLLGAGAGGRVGRIVPQDFSYAIHTEDWQRSHFSSPCRQGVMRPVSLQSSRKLRAYSLDFHRHNCAEC